MAAIEGFTEAQNASLANVEVGNIVLVDQILSTLTAETTRAPTTTMRVMMEATKKATMTNNQTPIVTTVALKASPSLVLSPLVPLANRTITV
jgi:hypothetical protein